MNLATSPTGMIRSARMNPQSWSSGQRSTLCTPGHLHSMVSLQPIVNSHCTLALSKLFKSDSRMFWMWWLNVLTWMIGPICRTSWSIFLSSTEMHFKIYMSTKLNIFKRPAPSWMFSSLKGRTTSYAAWQDAFSTMDIGPFMMQSLISYVSKSMIWTSLDSFLKLATWRKMQMRKLHYIFYGWWRR